MTCQIRKCLKQGWKMDDEKWVEGMCHLCIVDEGAWFQGRLISAAMKQFGVIGEISNPPDGGFHECCFDEDPMFYTIKVMDLETKKEMIYNHVAKSNGDNCSLTSEYIQFETEELLVGDKAETYISKYGSPNLKEKDCIVCVGQMRLTVREEALEA